MARAKEIKMGKKFVPSEHLSDDINKNIMQSELDGGLKLEEIEVGETIKVQTRNTLYTIKKIANDEYEISGNEKFCSVPKKCYIAGSTWGGSMLKMGFIGLGMFMEGNLNFDEKSFLTSQIKSIEYKGKILNEYDIENLESEKECKPLPI